VFVTAFVSFVRPSRKKLGEFPQLAIVGIVYRGLRSQLRASFSSSNLHQFGGSVVGNVSEYERKRPPGHSI
jgi:hypothetical protein